MNTESDIDVTGEAMLIYDGECPFCTNYVKLLQLREQVRLQLVNARSQNDIVRRIQSQGYDLDEGFVLIIGERYYHGHECLNVLALLSTRVTWFNRINRWVFTKRTVARCLYPVLRTARNITLKAMGRKPIEAGTIDG